VFVEEASETTLLASHSLGGVPGVGVVFVDVVVVHVVTAMSQLPRPVGNKKKAVSHIADEIIEPLILREGSMTTVMSDHLQRRQEKERKRRSHKGGEKMKERRTKRHHMKKPAKFQ
jgi:hypothetical protein